MVGGGREGHGIINPQFAGRGVQGVQEVHLQAKYNQTRV